ncbi:uncharacterized protein BDV14DRAFT_73533 [Aspergillus stella-maris]|uniref:uncharacterized protein n=1 Tax=Aspergillus stella-maris TaxID=1810926 RepID=UPI003CCDC54C
MDKSEILVHISAPSGAGDDARYRAQVEAILNFQAHSREAISFRADERHESLASTAPDPRHLQPTNSETIDSPPPPVLLGPEPSHRAPKRHASLTDSLETPVSCIPDSQPPVQPSQAAEDLSLLPEVTPGSLGVLSKRPRLGSPPTANSLPNEELQLDVAEDLNTKDLNAGASSPLTKCPALPSFSAEENPSTQPQPGPKEAQKSFFLSLPQQIKPPSPPVSQAPFTTHITPTLEMLTKRLNPPRTYKPTAQTRDLDIHERGYWYLRLAIKPPTSEAVSKNVADICGSQPWDTTSFTKFWTFLSDFISKDGRAGWGVWCILEDASQDGDNSEVARSSQVPQGQDQDQDQEAHRDTVVFPEFLSLTLKVYTWGETATHIYLLLFLASNRCVRKMGAQWRDSRDEVVIQMP